MKKTKSRSQKRISNKLFLSKWIRYWEKSRIPTCEEMNRYGLVQFYASDYENTFPKMNLMRRSTHTFRMKMNHMPFQNSNNGLPYCFNRNESHAIDTILWTACWKLTDDPLYTVLSSKWITWECHTWKTMELVAHYTLLHLQFKYFHYDLKRCSTLRAIPSWSTLAWHSPYKSQTDSLKNQNILQ